MRTTRKPAPRQGNRPSPNKPSTNDSSLYRPEDGYQAPTASDIYEASVVAAARELGYGLYVRCLECRRPLTSWRSVAEHLGPVCRSRRSTDA